MTHSRWAAAAATRWLLGITLAALLTAGCGDDDGGSNQQNQNQNENQAQCGNGELDSGEACDEGAANSDVVPDACRTDCREAGCGDGVLDTGEVCDEGAANSDRVAGACRLSCELPACGDGVLDPGEQCDLGDLDNGDGCDAQCQVEPNWHCDAVGCACADYLQGDQCQTCVVLVDVDAAGLETNGLTWATAYPTVQGGIDRAALLGEGCEVWVAEGTYRIFSFGVFNTVELRTGIGVYGGFVGTETERSQRDWVAHPTVISGSDGLDPESRVFHVITAENTNDATLDGLTIEEGSATPPVEDPLLDLRGAGLRAMGSGVAVNHCRFVDHQSNGAGGAIAAVGSTVVVKDTVFLDNRGEGAAIYAYMTDLVVQDSRFVDNHPRGIHGTVRIYNATALLERVVFARNTTSGAGAGISMEDGDVVIRDSVFSDNMAGTSGAALFADNGGFITVEDTTFASNSANLSLGTQRGGAVMISGCDAEFISCVFWNNDADDGGAIYTDFGANVELVNCTLAYNEADEGGAIHLADFSWSFDLINSIVYHNTANTGPGLFRFDTDITLVVDHSDVQGHSGGTANLDQDPGFESVAGQGTTWSAVSYDAALGLSVFEDDTRSWTPGAFRGMFLTTDSFCPDSAHVILDNTATTITVGGDVIGCAENGNGTGYAIASARLGSGSVCIDVADPATAPATDLDGNPRVDGNASGSVEPDMGAYERP